MRLSPLSLTLLIALPALASSQPCSTAADVDCDGTVNMAELTGYIGIWYGCSDCAPDLLSVIQAYYESASVPGCSGIVCGGDGVLDLSSTGGYAELPGPNVTDMDYSRDFSVELIADIPPHRGGGRWASFIQRGGSLYASTRGWGIGLNQGFADSFGQQFVANIGDGVNMVGITSGSHEGTFHVVMTFDAETKTMHLFTNGVDRANKTNALLYPPNITNSGSLVIGKAANLIQRDVMMARLWNRLLAPAEVSALYGNYNLTGHHGLPEGFDRAALVSEWLMLGTSDASGGPGSTHLLDTASRNHLLLKGNATLLRAEGPLSLAYPSDGASGIDKAVRLRVSGGAGSLGGSFMRPLSYQFLIDEEETFDSPALKDSGWIKGRGAYVPVLKPSTIYYWKARVRDSSAAPEVSAFTGTFSFTTEGPTDWFVRPGVYSGIANEDEPVPVTGVYGRQDGTSYEDAWNGITSIVWGEDGVEAGDELYVCGENLYNNTSDGWYVAGVEYIRESGHSAEFPITIRMDCSRKDPAYEDGVLWGTYPLRLAASNIVWEGPDANGVYWTDDLPRRIGTEYNGTDYVWLNTKNSTTWTGDPGSTYVTVRDVERWLVNMTYLKTLDGSPPVISRLWGSDQWGFRFDIGRSSYIRFLNCTFRDSRVGKQGHGSTLTPTNVPVPHHIVFDGCDLSYLGGTAIPIDKGNDNWIVRNCRIHDAGCGVYLTGSGGSKNVVVANNLIYDIGTANFPDGDSHAVGLQGGVNHTITHNTIWNAGGTAIELWTGLTNIMKNHTISYNFIRRSGTSPTSITSGSGISVSGTNGNSLGMRTGISVHHNIIMDTAIVDKGWGGNGIATNNPDPQDFYNNVIVNSRGPGIKFSIMGYNPAQGRVFNNIIINNASGYVTIGGNATLNNVSVDNNLYYPSAFSPGMFYDIRFGSLSFSDWKNRTGFDNHSLAQDPIFVSASPQAAADFMLQPGSPAINAGADLWGTPDFDGNPAAGLPDIGAHEFQGGGG